MLRNPPETAESHQKTADSGSAPLFGYGRLGGLRSGALGGRRPRAVADGLRIGNRMPTERAPGPIGFQTDGRPSGCGLPPLNDRPLTTLHWFLNRKIADAH
jgi:hypothetical protein